MVCRNICERIYSKIVVGESHYFVGKKYCRRCECYFITKKILCECCGMQLRGSPAERATTRSDDYYCLLLQDWNCLCFYSWNSYYNYTIDICSCSNHFFPILCRNRKYDSFIYLARPMFVIDRSCMCLLVRFPFCSDM